MSSTTELENNASGFESTAAEETSLGCSKKSDYTQGSDAKTRNVSSRLAMPAAAKTKTKIIGARSGGRCSLGPLKRAFHSVGGVSNRFPYKAPGVLDISRANEITPPERMRS
jgi:hypothetical protein